MKKRGILMNLFEFYEFIVSTTTIILKKKKRGKILPQTP